MEENRKRSKENFISIYDKKEVVVEAWPLCGFAQLSVNGPEHFEGAFLRRVSPDE